MAKGKASLSVTCRKHIEAICAAWQKGVASIVATGEKIARAQASVDDGKFEEEVLPNLPFSRSTAYRLMAIASHPVLSNVAHVRHLPPSWGTLDALTKVPQTRLTAAIKSGDVHPGMERKDVAELLPAHKKSKKKSAAAKRQSDDPESQQPDDDDDEVQDFTRRVTEFVLEQYAPDFEQWMKTKPALDGEARNHLGKVLEECSLQLQKLAQLLR